MEKSEKFYYCLKDQPSYSQIDTTKLLAGTGVGVANLGILIVPWKVIGIPPKVHIQSRKMAAARLEQDSECSSSAEHNGFILLQTMTVIPATSANVKVEGANDHQL